MEFELEEKQLAEIALFVYQQYKKSMTPPVLMVFSFEEWLQRIIAKNEEDDRA